MDEVRCPCDQCHGLRGHPAPDFPWKDYDVIDPKDVESLELPDSPHGSRHRYLVCDHKVWAIMLKTRTWGMNLTQLEYRLIGSRVARYRALLRSDV